MATRVEQELQEEASGRCIKERDRERQRVTERDRESDRELLPAAGASIRTEQHCL